MNLEILVLGAALLAIFSIFFYTLITGAPPTPTSPRVCRAVIRALPAQATGPVYELGAGWGGLALELARRYENQTIRSYEISPLPWVVTWLRALVGGAANLEPKLGDFMKVPLSDASLVVLYLGVEGTEKLRRKLESELQPGALVLSHTFAIRGWTPILEDAAADIYQTPVFLYRI